MAEPDTELNERVAAAAEALAAEQRDHCSRHRIEVFHWRDRSDVNNDDTCDILLQEAGDETTPQDLIAGRYDVVFDDSSAHNVHIDDDAESAVVISEASIDDGQIIESTRGNRFRVTIAPAARPTMADVLQVLQRGYRIMPLDGTKKRADWINRAGDLLLAAGILKGGKYGQE